MSRLQFILLLPDGSRKNRISWWLNTIVIQILLVYICNKTFIVIENKNIHATKNIRSNRTKNSLAKRASNLCLTLFVI